MAEWVQARTDLDTDPVVIAQAKALNMPTLSVAFLWVKFWGWCREHTATGRIERVTHDVVDAAIGVAGFAKSAGHWVVFDDTGLTLPKWDKHNDNGARKRFVNQKRKQKQRKKESRFSHEGVTQQRDGSVTRRDKKRIDKKYKTNTGEVVFSDGFSRFWEAYPNTSGRREKKLKCFEIWEREGLEDIAEKLIADVNARKHGRKWTKDGGQYIEATQSYLNGKVWLDATEAELLAPTHTDWKAEFNKLPPERREELGREFRDRKLFSGFTGSMWDFVAERLSKQENAA